MTRVRRSWDITERQRSVLAAIRAHIADHGEAPQRGRSPRPSAWLAPRRRCTTCAALRRPGSFGAIGAPARGTTGPADIRRRPPHLQFPSVGRDPARIKPGIAADARVRTGSPRARPAGTRARKDDAKSNGSGG